MPDLRVDPLLSYARRVGDQVQVILEVAGDPPAGADVALRLRGGRSVDQPVTVASSAQGRFRVEALIPGDRLPDGTWRMKLVADGRQSNLQTRLLLRAGMPIALLPGRPPDTVLPEPEPRG